LGYFAIILGAFGAHALKKVLSLDQLATFETGPMQTYRAHFLLLIGIILNVTQKQKNTSIISTLFG
jgi:uncharacterized membrane protein YgdD (TMEM256/DUF423 family)